MAGRILVLGAAGRLGQVAAEAFREGGWDVVSLVRPGSSARPPRRTRTIEIDARDHAAVAIAAQGADVVLHALNAPYAEWSRLALPLAYSAVNAAKTAGATLMLVGNLYNHGSPLPPVIDESTPMRPSAQKGRLRVLIEDHMAEAAEQGARGIVLRAGDFLGGRRGGWLDLVIAKEIDRGRITYPGPIDIVHEWAYLPDVAATLVRLAAIRERLSPFEAIGFPGHAVTGRELTAAIVKASGHGLTVKRMSWWLIHALRPFVPLSRELSEIAYFWNEPHHIDGAKLHALIGDIPRTALDVAVARALEDLRAAP
ncbi:MAG: NAD(P)H-binding protein [Hyphomicrobiales bacterium]|nr:NAD(P)H-binding protein [Hyphomicrobiales bacterium]